MPAGALVRGELLTQGEIFQDQRLSMDEEAAQEASEQGHPGILAGVGKSNDFRRDGVFADYDPLSHYCRCSGTHPGHQDRYVVDHPLEVEKDKPLHARGTFLYPEGFEQQVADASD